VGPSRESGYLNNSSAKVRITRAVTNRQSMAIVMASRNQDDFSSIDLPPLREHGPQVVAGGLRTDDPIFRTDLRYRSHTRKEGDLSFILD
jgi:hypothetical protein